MIRHLLAAIVAVSLAPAAFAQNAPLGQKPSWTSAESSSPLPGSGDVQLFLDAPPILNATNLTADTVTRGFGFLGGEGGSQFGFGINGGVGYFITDMLEIGGALALDFASIDSASAFEFGLEPFAKLNLGRVISDRIHLNPYVSLGLLLGAITGDTTAYGGNTGLFGVDLDLGVEFFLSRGWGLSAFIPVGIFVPTNGSPVAFGFGLGYGLVTYF